MKKLLGKIPKSIIITQSAFLILGGFFIPKYLIFLFHVGIFKYYGIPEEFINFNSFSYIITSHYFLIHILAYLSVFFLFISIVGYISYSISKEIDPDSKNTKDKPILIYIFFIIEIIFLVCLLFLGKIEILTFLTFSVTLSLIIGPKLVSNNNTFYLNCLFFIYSLIIVSLLAITIPTNYLVGKGEQYAQEYKLNNYYDAVEINGIDYVILQYNKNNLLSKKILGGDFEDSYFIFGISSIEGLPIKKIKLSNN